MPLDDLARANGDMTGQPLCPACRGGRLHPYKVEIKLPGLGAGGGWHGADGLVGWVAVCKGNASMRRAIAERNEQHPDDEPFDDEDPIEACGFALPMQPHRWDLETRRPVPVVA